MIITSVIDVGNSNGIIFPKEIMKMLGVSKGSKIGFGKTVRGVEISIVDDELEEQIKVISEIMEEDKDVFRILAKK